MLAGKMLEHQRPSEPLYTHCSPTDLPSFPTEVGSACLVGVGSAPWLLHLRQGTYPVLCSQRVQDEANGELIGNSHYKPPAS